MTHKTQTTSRRQFLATATKGAAVTLAISPLLSHGLGCQAPTKEVAMDKTTTPQTTQAQEPTKTTRMPVIFVGHGSPMNAIEDTAWSRGFAQLGQSIEQPRAILAISAHWYINGTYITADTHPKTIHDFGGFPQALFEVQYPAPGKVSLAQKVRQLIGQERAGLSTSWGLDHGTWSVLKWMYPEANIPVIQLSMDRRLSPQQHYDIGRSLLELREEGVLIMGSGNIVHNLRDAVGRMQSRDLRTPDWAKNFDEDTFKRLTQRDTSNILTQWRDSDDGRRAHPTPEHWLPMIYAYAATDEKDQVSSPVEGFDWGSLSMRNVTFSAT